MAKTTPTPKTDAELLKGALELLAEANQLLRQHTGRGVLEHESPFDPQRPRTWPKHPSEEEKLSQRIEAVRQQIVATAGPDPAAAKALDNLVIDYDNLTGDRETLALRHHLYNVGIFLCEHGDRDVWRLLWVKYGIAVDNRDGWSLGERSFESYAEGDELAFVYGKDWREHRERLDRETAPPPDPQ